MQTDIANIENKVNAVKIIGDYEPPQGMVDFKKPADMMTEMMSRVMNDPKNKDNVLALQAMAEGCKVIVNSGIAQNQQASTLVDLLRVNQKLNLI
jgi:hypothetical protein